MDTIILSDGRKVLKSDYIKAKTWDLNEFGNSYLTPEDVSEQLVKILNNEELTVIGMFMKRDIDLEATNNQ